MNKLNSPVYSVSVQYAMERISCLGLPASLSKIINIGKFSEANASYYQDYPALFAGAYRRLHPSQLRTIATAGLLYYKSILTLDSIVDGDEPENPHDKNGTLALVGMSVCQEEAIKLLASVYPLTSPFWAKWNQRRREYLGAYFTEKELVKKPVLNATGYAKVAADKAAFGRVAIDCLRELSGDNYEEVTQILLKSHWEYSYGLQLLDDFQDFTLDGESGQLNYFQSRLNEYLASISVSEQNPLKRKTLLYTTGVAEKGLALAAQRFARSEKLLEDVCQPIGFSRIVREAMDSVANIREQIRQYFSIIEVKTRIYSEPLEVKYSLPATNNLSKEQSAKTVAITYILNQANRGFPELKHLMYLGAGEGFNNDRNVHIADVFQRAILADCLSDFHAQQPSDDIMRLLNDEVAYLKSQRLSEGVQAWSYYPTVQEIAPDIDDLGQIMQCFARVKDSEAIDTLCAPLLDFLAAHNFCEAEGAYETWLVPRSGRSHVEQLRDRFNREKWGKGPDPEVVANLLYGASTAGLPLPRHQVKSCIEYLKNQQTKDGSWLSRWYHGPYYGTYVGLRALVQAGQGKEVIPAARSFLLEHQSPNGSFKNNILHTALGSLALHQCASTTDAEIDERLTRASAYLTERLNSPEPITTPTEFIIPKAGLPFGSITLELGYALKALSVIKSI